MKNTVLIVDDSPIIRERFVEAISELSNSIRILQASSLKEGIMNFEMNSPDFVVLDIALPDGSGFEMLKRVKTSTPNITTVMLTNYSYPQLKKKAFELGADYFFDKSKEFNSLIDILTTISDSAQITLPKSLEQNMRSILVVDDSITLRRMVIASLKEIQGFNFHEANSGLEALEQLALTKIDLIILDLNMPDMHGIEVLQFLRNHQMYSNIPVIILTTRSDDSSREIALSAGATIYLTKPFSPQILQANVKKLLGIE